MYVYITTPDKLKAILTKDEVSYSPNMILPLTADSTKNLQVLAELKELIQKSKRFLGLLGFQTVDYTLTNQESALIEEMDQISSQKTLKQILAQMLAEQNAEKQEFSESISHERNLFDILPLHLTTPTDNMNDCIKVKPEEISAIYIASHFNRTSPFDNNEDICA